MATNNGPEYLLPLTGEQLRFLKLNCESNIVLGLGILQECGSEDAAFAKKVVALNEQFKEIRDALIKLEKGDV